MKTNKLKTTISDAEKWSIYIIYTLYFAVYRTKKGSRFWFNVNYICGVNANGVRYSAREDEQLEKERCYLFKVLFCCDSELQKPAELFAFGVRAGLDLSRAV